MHGDIGKTRTASLHAPSLNSTNLKTAAAICMLLDHAAGGVFWISLKGTFPSCGLGWLQHSFRMSGRTAFPVFSFFLVEGFFLTRNRRQYHLRMLVSAVLSEIPFNLCMNGTIWFPAHQNALFTMASGLLLMEICEQIKRRVPDHFEQLVFCLSTAVFLGIPATVFQFDYKLPGLFLICILYLFHGCKLKQCLTGFISFLWEPASLTGFLMLLCYNGKRGKQEKYFFYFFYPYHLLLLYLLSLTLPPA